MFFAKHKSFNENQIKTNMHKVIIEPNKDKDKFLMTYPNNIDQIK